MTAQEKLEESRAREAARRWAWEHAAELAQKSRDEQRRKWRAGK